MFGVCPMWALDGDDYVTLSNVILIIWIILATTEAVLNCYFILSLRITATGIQNFIHLLN